MTCTRNEVRASGREIAIRNILIVANTKRTSKVGPVHLTVAQLRRKFNSLESQCTAASLGINYQLLIDELILDNRLMVTNGFVWVRQ